MPNRRISLSFIESQKWDGFDAGFIFLSELQQPVTLLKALLSIVSFFTFPSRPRAAIS
jgi:hypothetical protein